MIEIVFEISVENSSVCSFEHKMCFSFCVAKKILSLLKGELCQKKNLSTCWYHQYELEYLLITNNHNIQHCYLFKKNILMTYIEVAPWTRDKQS